MRAFNRRGIRVRLSMQTLTRTGLVALVFLAGCAVGGASSQLVASQANAQGPAVPPAKSPQTQKWDYLCLDFDHRESITDEAKKAGREGWEMVTVIQPLNRSVIWCFKRPL